MMDRRVKLGLAAVLLLLLAAAVVAWKMGVNLASLKGMWQSVEAYLKANPYVLFWTIVFIPGLPVPTSFLLVMAGAVWKDQPIIACLICILAMLLNLSWTYWLAAGPARRLVEKLLAATSIKIPDLPRGDHLKLILVMRLTPGLPFFFQNYVLGFLRPPFLLYLSISILCSGVVGTGIVLISAGAADGNLKWAIFGISLIVVGGVLIQFLRSWLAKRRTAASAAGV